MSVTAPRTAPRVGKVGERLLRDDAVPKVKGAFDYSSDLSAPGMLWGDTLRSPHPHARIVSVDMSKALALPGVHAILTHADVPGRKTYGLEFPDQPVLAIDRVRYVGEPVAVVAASHPEQAREALAAIEVEYEPLEPVVDMERALEQEPLHPDRPTMGHGYLDDPRPNVVRHLVIRHGDPEAPGEVVVHGEYEVGMQDQAFLGPESGSRRPGRRRRRRHLRGDPVAARRPRPGRLRASTSARSRCGSSSPASAARSAAARTSPCRSTARCSRSTRAAP